MKEHQLSTETTVLPVWSPQQPQESRMWAFMQLAAKLTAQPFHDYEHFYEWSLAHPEVFWPLLANYFNVHFHTPPKSILTGPDMQHSQWFQDATLNFAEHLLSGKACDVAIVSINEAGERQTLTYAQLQEQVAQCAAGLRKLGIRSGDRVVGILPNIAITVIAMLATTSLGAIWACCSPDFGLEAAVDRLGQIEPRVLLMGDGHIYQGKRYPADEKITQLQQAIPSLEHIVICPILNTFTAFNDYYLSWAAFLVPHQPLTFEPFPFAHPLYILFSSGTTGKPKCIIHGAGNTLLQHLKELGLHTDIHSHDNLCFYTTSGWMMWNWMVSTLALGATVTLYEGAAMYPDAGRLFDLIEKEKISVFGTSAKFISAVEKTNISPNRLYSLESLRCILSTGSPLLPRNYDFVYQDIKSDVQLSSISGGTDIVSCFALGNPILPVYKGELQCFGLGMAVAVFDESGKKCQQQRGELVCTKPFPSMPIGFWNDPTGEKYHQAYFSRFPGIWAHGDYAEITAHQGLIIYGRSDTVLNPGGVRIGTAEIYRQVETIPEIEESIVVGQEWQDDVRIILFVKLKSGLLLTDELKKCIRQNLREHASPRHIPSKILQVSDIPRTISGKIVEVAVREVIHNRPINNLTSIANPKALEDFTNRKELQEA